MDLDETLLYRTETTLDRAADFVVQCRDSFRVAVRSSASRSYVPAVVGALFPGAEDLVFVLASDRCTLRYDDEQEAYYWAKSLRKLTRRGYAAESIIAVDDSPEKRLWRSQV